MLNHLNSRRTHEKGLSIVELLVGVAIGLFIVAAASFFSVTLTKENRLLLVEARLAQDMRSAMDLVTKEIRRAGYWGNSLNAAWYVGASSIATPYVNTAYTNIAVTNGGASIAYSYTPKNVTAGSTPSDNEKFGVQVVNGVLQAKLNDGGFAQLTDPATTFVNSFTVTETTTQAYLSCPVACVPATPDTCPKVSVRQYRIVLNASSRGTNPVTRELDSLVRVRNDVPSGACP